MNTLRRWSITLVMSTVVAAPAILAGCSGHTSVRYYDADYTDYHPWNHNEVVFYGRWETETHHNHVEFNARTSDEQREYWRWRHSHH